MQIEASQLPWLVLHLVPGMSGPRLCRLLEIRGTADALLHCSPSELITLGWSMDLAQRTVLAMRDPWGQLPELKAIANWAARPGNRLLTPTDDDYPAVLQKILPDPPPVLYLRGDSALLHQPHLAVVGSRKPSAANRRLTHDWCRELAAAGLIISSGLAKGIDAAAHRGTLAASGQTLAVLGSGLDNVYPTSHVGLVDDILASGGAILSELPPDTPPYAGNFPKRNRLVAALAEAVLVVEAAQRSGSLITARLAAEYGREVLALPGHPHEEGSQGTNRLIQDGAMLVDQWHNVADLFGHLEVAAAKPADQALTDFQARVFKAIGTLPTALETLSVTLDCPPEQLYEPLLELEISGLVGSQGGSYVRLRGP
ncbi:MAG: DNA-processing protein DprA [Natronospirillum sp.]|uniref:DNA-processing protein DprA n=1 Tax=Natronospirillum sp. TaxID=2812955 RepID=UPI0025F0EF5A|nr:DNA-processing protein DprA [Natronospirillum sp.]MCH8552190.1 DNA-processing protein DprA [Natronospirillum sp.]